MVCQARELGSLFSIFWQLVDVVGDDVKSSIHMQAPARADANLLAILPFLSTGREGQVQPQMSCLKFSFPPLRKVQETRDLYHHVVIGDSTDRVCENIILNFFGYLKLFNLIYSPDLPDGGISTSLTLYKGMIPYTAVLPGLFMWLRQSNGCIVETHAMMNNYETGLAKALDEGMNMEI